MESEPASRQSAESAGRPASPSPGMRLRRALALPPASLGALGLLALVVVWPSLADGRLTFGVVEWPGVAKSDVALGGMLAAAALAAAVPGRLARRASSGAFLAATLITIRSLLLLPTLPVAWIVLAAEIALLSLAVVQAPAAAAPSSLRLLARHELALTVAGCAIVAFAYSYPTLVGVGPGLDASWHTGLVLAVHEHLVFGRDLVFTYGPLGFLKFPALYYQWLSLAAWVYVAAVRLATAALLAWACYRSFGSRVGALLGAVIGSIVIVQPAIWELGYAAPVTVLTIVWAGIALDEGSSHLAYRLIPVVGGALTAVEFLAKLTIGVLVPVLLLYVVLVAGRRRLRDVAIFAACFAAATALLLLATRQPLDAFGDYVVRSWQVASGYSATVGGPLGLRTWLYGACALVILLAAAASSGRSRSGLRRLALPGLMLLYAFLGYRAAYAGGGHLGIYFTSMVGAWFAVPWNRLGHRLVALPVGGGAFVALIALLAVGTGTALRDVVGYGPSLSRWPGVTLNEARRLLSPSELRSAVRDDRESLREEYAIPRSVVAAIGADPVHVDPFEASVAWAYGLDWRPVPVFQAYEANTRPLDELNAAAYRSAAGPARILREIGWTPADRNPSFESPAAIVAMVCNFRHVVGAGPWEVLRRVPDRCGSQREIGSATLRYGEPIRVPRRPESLVTARLEGVGDGVLGRLRDAVYRSRVRTVTVNGRTAHLVPDTAADGLLMHVPARADYPGRFRISPDARTLTVDDETHSHRTIRVVFYARSIASP